MSAKIYRYVVRYDAGTAPKPSGGWCSLAICKPRIREKAVPGDWIVGFRSRCPGQVVYAMKVTERLALGEYWEDGRFDDRKPYRTSRPDNIYRPNAGGKPIQVPNRVHMPEHASTDVSGRNVLLSQRFWYFGRNSVPIPTHLVHLVHSTVGHSVDKHRRPDDLLQLEQWLDTWPVGMHGEPIDNERLGNEWPSEASLTSAPPRLVQGDEQVPRRLRRCAPSRSSRRRLAMSESAEQFVTPSNYPKRLILSRKGFDSGYGGIPSPIMPDGRLVPLPIPSNHDHTEMQHSGNLSPEFSEVLGDLSGGRYGLSSRVHLDPDLNRRSDLRLPGWRPSLGQSGTAQSHLASQGVTQGDVFLFFGWFREVEKSQGRWRYVPSAPNLHALYGWLEVGDVLSIVLDRQGSLQRYPWIADHPHFANPVHYSNSRNTLYIASEHSNFRPDSVGGGIFSRLEEGLCLTMKGQSRSKWQLPAWFYPEGRTPLSYHGRLDRWTKLGDQCSLNSVAKGQEFVLRLDEYPESSEWLKTILSEAAVR